MARNANLQKAQDERNDEFYTLIGDIEEEVSHYPGQFRDKRVLCNCDDPDTSMFVRFFKENFSSLGLRSLAATHYVPGGSSFAYVFDGKAERRVPIAGDGDFRSAVCLDYLDASDVVVTNPPFSLFRDFVEVLVSHGKEFLIVGNKNALTFKETFAHLMADRLWVGYRPMGKDMLFDVPEKVAEDMVRDGKEWSQYRIVDGKVYGRAAACWFTNMTHGKRNRPLKLDGNRYSPEKYPRYDNYGAVEVGKVSEIPGDYAGIMGVPVTFLDKYCPAQFEIVGMDEAHGKGHSHGLWEGGKRKAVVGDKAMYARVFLRKK